MLGLDIAYLCTKFDHSIFSRSGDMIGAHQNLHGSLDLTTPLSGMVCHSWATINLRAKFKVSIVAHYEDVKIDTKCRKTGGLGVIRGRPKSLKIALFDRAHRAPISLPW